MSLKKSNNSQTTQACLKTLKYLPNIFPSISLRITGIACKNAKCTRYFLKVWLPKLLQEKL